MSFTDKTNDNDQNSAQSDEWKAKKAEQSAGRSITKQTVVG